MGQSEFLARLIEALDAAGIRYMISGSLGSSAHGEPRATNDVDLVIFTDRAGIESLITLLGDGWYVDRNAALEALKRRSMFNVIDMISGWKADLIIRKNRAYSIEEFGRRMKGEIDGVSVFVAAPEDIILSKLEWSAAAESERQYRDALGVAVVQWQTLDKNYLRKWAPELGVDEILERLLEDAAQLYQADDGDGNSDQ
ncbi:MAG: hypothetical protein QME74_04315 [Candidatus Edwardsbacteria bacterium]|nr:hypothetical protein [Candidatus Edwardsbacteria bacterium]